MQVIPVTLVTPVIRETLETTLSLALTENSQIAITYARTMPILIGPTMSTVTTAPGALTSIAKRSTSIMVLALHNLNAL